MLQKALLMSCITIQMAHLLLQKMHATIVLKGNDLTMHHQPKRSTETANYMYCYLRCFRLPRWTQQTNSILIVSTLK